MGLQAQTHALNLSVELMDNEKLGSKAEVWVKGMGSWFLNNDYNPNDQVNKFGLVSTKTPELHTDQEYDLFFYPNGRDGKEISVKFKIDSNFCTQGCPRDAVSITVYKNEVRFFGRPIEEVYGEIEINRDI